MVHEKREKQRLASPEIEPPHHLVLKHLKTHPLLTARDRERQLPRFLCALVVVGGQIHKELWVKVLVIAKSVPQLQVLIWQMQESH
jgi:hypothetical protein